MSAKKQYVFPEECRYTESDEWVRVDSEGVRIGITDYAQNALSDIVFVELPEVGSQLETGQPFGVVESVKAVSDLIAPLSGEVVAVNGGLEDHPEWVNEDPHERGWIVLIRPEEVGVVDSLLTPEQYRKHVAERSKS